MTTDQSAAITELERARQTYTDVLAVLPLSEAAKRTLLAAASSWAKAAAGAVESRQIEA